MDKQASEAVNMLMNEGIDFDSATEMVIEKVASLGALGGAIASTDGHRWGGAGTGFLGDALGTAVGTVAGGAGTLRGVRTGSLVGLVSGTAAGHYYGKHAQRKDALHKKASFDSLIEDGVDFDTAIALVQKFF